MYEIDKPSAAIDWIVSQKGADAGSRAELERAVQFAVSGATAR